MEISMSFSVIELDGDGIVRILINGPYKSREVEAFQVI